MDYKKIIRLAIIIWIALDVIELLMTNVLGGYAVKSQFIPMGSLGFLIN